jgi:hypothetical protein
MKYPRLKMRRFRVFFSVVLVAGSAAAQTIGQPVAYKPASFQHDGRYRTIAITAKKSGRKLKVNSRKGYYTEASAAR